VFNNNLSPALHILIPQAAKGFYEVYLADKKCTVDPYNIPHILVHFLTYLR
jgi:hypothetical protein